MGMSASQMRYCLISGKKSDVEFQGQQINQQRTVLATESSAYNSQLLNMSVPTPPSTSDYTKTTYSFNLGSVNCNVTGTTYDSKTGLYDVNYSYATTGAQAETGQAVYYKSTTTSTNASGQTVKSNVFSTGLTENTKTTLTKVQSTDDNFDVLNANLETIYGENYKSAGDYYYTKSGSSYRFVTAAQLASIEDNGSKTLKYSYVDEDASITQRDKMENVNITWSDTGRMNTITTTDSKGEEVTYTMSVQSSTDNEAYEAAYNEYEYAKSQYNQQMNKINAQICIIEAQDKKLELKLQDLDTQQQALSTEMESVKKVIDKNIDNSFKAFA